MEHDPLCYVAKNGGQCCPWIPDCNCQCMCDLILEVRQDDQAKTEELAEKMFKLGYDQAIKDMAEANKKECTHEQTPDVWVQGTPYCRQCGHDMSSEYEMGN